MTYVCLLLINSKLRNILYRIEPWLNNPVTDILRTDPLRQGTMTRLQVPDHPIHVAAWYDKQRLPRSLTQDVNVGHTLLTWVNCSIAMCVTVRLFSKILITLLLLLAEWYNCKCVISPHSPTPFLPINIGISFNLFNVNNFYIFFTYFRRFKIQSILLHCQRMLSNVTQIAPLFRRHWARGHTL